MDYKKAGVDISAGNELVERIKPYCVKTHRSGVVEGPGGFAGLFRLADLGYRNPLLVAATDGVGTKLKIARTLDRYDTIGIDLVAMCVNDILVSGGEPFLFLDYLACEKLIPNQAADIIKGVAAGCETAGCTLLGGETAEMPGMYPGGEYDIAGFCVGIVEEDALCGPSRVEVGDAIIGLASSGIHSNGFSLVRRIIEQAGIGFDSSWGEGSLGEVLLMPTTIYVKTLLPLIKQNKIHALAHITGGGLTENLPRSLNDKQLAHLYRRQWQRPEIFNWLQETGGVEEDEMLRVFNCGIGMALIVADEICTEVIEHLNEHGCQAYLIGEVNATDGASCVVYD